VRWALAHAIDKNFILQKADYGLGRVATGPISSETAWFYNGDVRRFEYDRKKAELLLDEAGYKRGPDGVRFRVGVIANRGLDLFTKTAEIIAEQLKQVGIEVKVQILDRTTMLTAIFQKRNFDMWVHGFATGPDPDLSVARLYVSSNIRPAPFTNGAGYRNQKVDDLFAKAGRAASREERARLYRKMQETIVEDQPYVWLLEYGLNSAFKADFSGLHTWAPAGYYQLDEVWWKKGRPKP
jgi:peptide/nickel transport system substrate-binding protein